MQEQEPNNLTQNVSECQEVRKEEGKSIFTDPEGPYLNAPKKLRDLYDQIREGQQINLQRLDLSKLDLPEKKTENNFCSRYMEANQTFYVCSNCSFRASIFSSMVFCISCFEPEKHIGHDVRDRSYGYKSGAYCDCGRIDRLKQSSLCRHHSDYNTEIECEITEQERKYFIDCFSSIVQCSIYSENAENESNIISNITEYFNKLNQNSVYYNRLIFEFLNKPIKNKKQFCKNNIYFLFFHQDQQFFVHLGGDLRTRINLAKLMLTLPDNQKQLERPIDFQNSTKDETINVTTIQHLIDEEFQYHKLIEVVQRCQNKDKINKDKIIKLYSQLISKAKNIQQLRYYQNNLKGLQSSVKILKKVSQILNFNTKNLQTQQAQKKQVISEQEKNIGSRFLGKCLGIIALSKRENMLNIRQQLIKLGFSDDSIDNMLEFMIQNSQGLVATQFLEGRFNEKIYFLLILLLLRQSKKNKELREKLWNNIHKYVKQHCQNKFAGLVDVFHYYICILLNVQVTMIMDSREFLDEPIKDYSEKTQQKLQNWFRCLLYQVKEISRAQVIDFRNKGVLGFKGAGKILNELCTYNEQLETFYYKTSNVYKNVINQFPLIPTRQNLGAIFNNHIKFGESIPVQEGSLSNCLIQEFLNSDVIVPLFEKTKNTSSQEGQSEVEDKCGYLYLFFLVVFDALKNKQNTQLRQKLQKLRDNQQLIDQYSKNPEQVSLIKRLLNKQAKNQLKMEEKEQKEQNQSQVPVKKVEVNQKIIKAQEKKRKIAQKYEQKRLKLLQNMTSFKNHSQSHQDEETCILCHEKSKEDNQLFYLTSVGKNISCGAFYGKNNLCNMSLVTCFHALHFECFKNLAKQSDQSFQCPLCHAQRNCILPVSMKYNKTTYKICHSVMTACLVFIHKIYNVDNLFMIIFKHLVQSKGLNSILSVSRYAEKKNSWQKNDDFLQMIICSIYQNSTEAQKQEYVQQIKQIISLIQKCQQKQHRTIQLLVAQAVKQVVTLSDEHIVENLLTETRSIVDGSNFAIINAQITSLFEHQYALPEQTEQQAQRPKPNLSLSPIQLPLEAKDFFVKYDLKGTCQVCNNGTRQFLCLICGQLICRGCLQKHSNEIHCGASIIIEVRGLTVHCSVGRDRANGSIYANDFRINYNQRLESQFKAFENDNFYLNQPNLNKFVNKCLLN